MKIIIGIDTGATGAISIFVNGTLERVLDTPFTKTARGKAVVSGGLLADIIDQTLVDRAYSVNEEKTSIVVYVEDVHAMPRDGAAGSFSFGLSKGITLGVLEALQIPYVLISPQKWKRSFRMIGSDKDYSRTRAIAEFPHFRDELKYKKNVDRADAIWIGYWGVMYGDK